MTKHRPIHHQCGRLGPDAPTIRTHDQSCRDVGYPPRSYNYTLSKLGQTLILPTFHACHPANDTRMTAYFTCLIDCRNQLSCFTEEITEETIVTHLLTQIPKKCTTMINIIEQQPTPPISQYIIAVIRLNEEVAAFVTSIGDASAGASPHSQRGGYHRQRHGCG
jgi:hypothetical protein